MMNKTKQLGSLALALLIGSMISFTSCKNNEIEIQPISDKLAEYVYAHTSGIISRGESIQVKFNQAIVESEMIGKSAGNIMSFHPNISGKATWMDEQTVTFIPNDLLPPNQSYIGEIAVNSLINNLSQTEGQFSFSFHTKPMTYDIDFGGFDAEDANDLSVQILRGVLTTGDFANSKKVERILLIEQNNTALDIEWDHNLNGTIHEFSVQGIKRADEDGEIKVNWTGKPLNLDKKGEQVIEVPGLSNFKVTKSEVEQGDAQSIVLYFSDPLLKSQDLKGLVSFSNYSGDYSYTIDGNLLRIYPQSRLSGNTSVTIDSGIKNIQKRKMKSKSAWNLSFTQSNPAIKISGKGVIMPNSDGLVFPFEATNLKAIVVEVFKIYNNNVLQYLQTQNFGDNGYSLERVGSVIHQEKVDLSDLNPKANSNEWTNYALDLSKMFKQDPSAIYQIRLGFDRSCVNYYCENEIDESDVMEYPMVNDKTNEIKSIMDGYYGIYGRYNGFAWRDREKPCMKAFYDEDNFKRRTILASDLGIIAKQGTDKSVFVAVSDLRTTDPVIGAKVSFYDYQQQLIKEITTDGSGLITTQLDKAPFVAVASRGEERGYLKMQDGNALSLSRFDIAGAQSQKGLKGFIYGERGVWRPGDTLFLNFILEDKKGTLPANHPITFELTDPRGQLFEKRTTTTNVSNIYPLTVATTADVSTGSWIAKVNVGGARFQKTLKIETIKPNRLKINLDFGEEELVAASGNLTGDLQVNWLHGAPVQNLQTKVEMKIASINTTFDKYTTYEFDDPARSFESEPQVIFEDKVDGEGHAEISTKVNAKNAPGKLMAYFKTRAFEKGGDFSTDNQAIPYSPYDGYAGIYIPKNKYNSKRLDVDKASDLSFITLDKDGKPLTNRKLNIGVYRVNWRWWWDRDNDSYATYNATNHLNAQQKATVKTGKDGKADWEVMVPKWGRYMVRVCDDETGHCSGDFFYAGYPWNDNNSDKSAATMLAFSSDKESYKVGQTVKLNVPANELSRVLLTIENGTEVIESFWREAKKGENTFTFEATAAMAPTVYAHVSLIQPHAQTTNDLPIRMYGVIPIKVENPKTKLNPIVKMPDVLAPEQTVKVEVSEDRGRAMAYTLAIVDDGLLDLTRFKTPNPHDSFYAREALGVKTWDIYDQVLGAYGGKLERILSIGGDGDNGASNPDKKNANRFKPVVMHLGPFYLKKGQKANHTITLPNYVGSVRAMVVASDKSGAYGKTEKTMPVRKPLMVLATAPRVLSPTESLAIPINVFAMEKKVKNVQLTLEESSGLIKIEGDKTKSITFDKLGDQVVYFNCSVLEGVGIAKFKVTATSAGEKATQEMEIEIRNPNPFITDVSSNIINPGEDISSALNLVGMHGTNEGVLEVSSIPPLNLDKRLKYLIRYPHGCIEQTTSGAFPQLYLANILELKAAQKTSIPKNIQAGIERLKLFQLSNGSFSYWPGDNYTSEWGTNYAGHFLVEAKKAGYIVPKNMIDRWIRAQKKQAKSWRNDANEEFVYYRKGNNQVMQSYRLYGLAMAGSPELGAMNRMREMKNLSNVAKWQLAAAYALAGKKEVAKDLVYNVSKNIEDYQELGYTYGSSLRDEAIILETMILLDEKESAAEMLRQVAERISNNRWYSTQTLAYSLCSIGKYFGKNAKADKIAFAYSMGSNNTINAGTEKPMMQIDIPVDEMSTKSFSIKNNSKGVLFIRTILTGQPVIGDQTANADHLVMETNYLDIEGKTIDPTRLKQGTDFIAEVTIKNPGTRGIHYNEMALSQIFPSGWEIINFRMDNFDNLNNVSKADYQNIRDDRMYTYFDLQKGMQKTYRIQLNAAYQGKYYAPTTYCEAMYDNTINARQPGQWVEVVGVNEF